MRPTRLLLSIAFFALTVFLTYITLVQSHPPQKSASTQTASNQKRRFSALFSFHTPSILFPPSAVISLTDDNSTFFLARPAAFGPSLPQEGLSGQLWIGSGFSDDSLLRGKQSIKAEGELGCSDIPGWTNNRAQLHQISSNGGVGQKDGLGKKTASAEGLEKSTKVSKDDPKTSSKLSPPGADDSSDDLLHYPLSESFILKNGIGTPGHADIQSLQERAEIFGKVVLLSRGGCGFLEKVKWAQRRGAIAVIVGDNVRGGQLFSMVAHGDASNITIPSLLTTYTTAHVLSGFMPGTMAGQVQGSPVLDSGSPAGEGSSTTSQTGRIVDKSSKVTTKDQTSPLIGGSKSSNGQQLSSRAQAPQPTRKRFVESESWLRHFGTRFGIVKKSTSSDATRPPSSGRVSWIISDDWDDEPRIAKKATTTTISPVSPTLAKGKAMQDSSNNEVSTDNFVIGVHDWRDPDMIAAPVGKQFTSTTSSATAKSTPRTGKGKNGNELAGGSTTPGSGEYGKPAAGDVPKVATKDQQKGTMQDDSLWHKVVGHPETESKASSEKAEKLYKNKVSSQYLEAVEFDDSDKHELPPHREGLWVTMTPTTVSTSPLFDTLLVLVVSPLITLTIVYAMLLLRSRIRRRRWRAPKSVVDRLPVRTYHTMSASSSAVSSHATSPRGSHQASPLLQASPRSLLSRARPRSRTTSVISENLALPLDRSDPKKSSAAREKAAAAKKYRGKQVECVVCLEEYVDGQSRVMSLPCGHEFHAECITPWLTTRRRTCPICKGDVVRSMNGNKAFGNQVINRDEEFSSDDIQDQVVETANHSPSSAIPIPGNPDEDDLERGDEDALGATLVNEDDRDEDLMHRRTWRELASSLRRSAFGEGSWRHATRDQPSRDR